VDPLLYSGNGGNWAIGLSLKSSKFHHLHAILKRVDENKSGDEVLGEIIKFHSFTPPM
jgi:hypothetical protein